MEHVLNEKSQNEQYLSSTLSEKCEIIAKMEKTAIECEQLNEQHQTEMKRLSLDYEQAIREVADQLKIKYFEEQQQLLTNHQSQITQMSKQFEAEKECLNSSLVKKGEEIAELYNRARKEAEELRDSSKLASEQALQEQKKLFQERIYQVKLLREQPFLKLEVWYIDIKVNFSVKYYQNF